MNSISYQLTALVTRSFERVFPVPETFVMQGVHAYFSSDMQIKTFSPTVPLTKTPWP